MPAPESTHSEPPGGWRFVAEPLRSGWRSIFVASLAFAVLTSGCLRRPSVADSATTDRFAWIEDTQDPVVTPSDEPAPAFRFRGKPFCFAGTNNYYLTYKSKKMVDDVLDQAKALRLSVVRVWGFIDRGSLDGSAPSVDGPGHKDGVYFQYWDSAAKRPAYNEGEDGLRRLDYALKGARDRGLKLLVVLTNNWRDFGGMDQYLAWYGLSKHHEFYTDERVRSVFKSWVHYLLNRKNSLDGTAYKDDPAIFAWELANEPRCTNDKSFDSKEGWDERTITGWAREMAAYVKSVDPNHLVAVGDEGFFNGGRKHWTYAAPNGVDHEALLAVEDVDFGTFHLYPDHWGMGYRRGYQWIEDHARVARKLGKPTILEEYGIIVRRDEQGRVHWGDERRRNAYVLWNDATSKRGVAGSLFWMLGGIDDEHGLYPDYDHFTIYERDSIAKLLSSYADRFATSARACELSKGDGGAPSEFVSVERRPRRPAPKPISRAGGEKKEPRS